MHRSSRARAFRRATALLSTVLSASVVGCAPAGEPMDWSTARSKESTRTPRQILADASHAIRGVRSYYLELRHEGSGAPTSTAGYFTARASARFSTRRGPATKQMIVVDGDVYIKANDWWWAEVLQGRATVAD